MSDQPRSPWLTWLEPRGRLSNAMAPAGFWAIETREITFGRDGNWYSDGERIANARIADLFSRSIHPGEDGGYELRIGNERATIEVEDTPYVVRQVEGSPDEGFRLLLNDGTRETLDPATLRLGPDDAFYCAVKRGRSEARLLRPAHYALGRFVTAAADGTFLLETGGRRYELRSPR